MAPYGHPDLILDHAVTGGLLSAAEAELIGRTRLEQTTLAEAAAELGASYEAVKRRRARAEHKLLTALADGTLSRYGYWPHPTRRHGPHAGTRAGHARGGSAAAGGLNPRARPWPGRGDSRPTVVPSRAGNRIRGCRSTPHPARHLSPPRGHPHATGPCHGQATRPVVPPPPSAPQEANPSCPSPVQPAASPRHLATATTPPSREAARHRTPRTGVLLLVFAFVWAASAGTAWAEPGMVVAAPASLAEVIGRLRTLIVGLLAAVATLYLTIGGVRYLTANGDPGAVGRAKEAFKHAAFGYALAALAPLLVTVLQQIVA
ncbi:MAG TPA: pilin [Streptosporangiaceae bacterium]